MKRGFDIIASMMGLVILGPFLLLFILLIWLQDLQGPFYIAARARSQDRTFRMVKLRSMIKNADQKGGASTAANDQRITWIGKFIRKTKFDEVPQLWNVLKGDMSLVGPRPQIPRDVLHLYTKEEYRLFEARPGITDFASIVFSDEGDILKGKENPDLSYNQLIRPWKSRLGILYTEHQGLALDLQLIWLTVVAILAKPASLRGIGRLLTKLGADPLLIQVASRTISLVPYPPPGATEVETRF